MSCELLIKLSNFFSRRKGTCLALTFPQLEVPQLLGGGEEAGAGSRPGLDPVGELKQGLLAVNDVQVVDVGL